MTRPSSDISRRHACGLIGGGLAGFCGGSLLLPGRPQAQLFGLTPDQERQIGAEEHPKIIEQFGGVYDDPRMGGYVAIVGAQLAVATGAQPTQFTFTLLDSPIVNAFAIPGGYVYVTRGLVALAGNEAELGSVLGHELGHVVARHASQRQSKSTLAQLFALGLGLAGSAAGVGGELGNIVGGLAGAYLQGFSREQEFEADTLGIAYLARAGYAPSASASFLAKLREHSRLEAEIEGRSPDEIDAYNVMATHPRTVERVERAAQMANVSGAGGRIGRDEFLDGVDGMTFGDDPDEGIIRGREFAHRALGFRFEVPAGFRLVNRPDIVVASTGRGDALIAFDLGDARFRGTMAEYIARAWAPKGVAVRDVERFQVNGMDAGTGWFRANTDRGQADIRMVAIRFDQAHVYRFQFVAPAQGRSRLDSVFRETAQSFRRLTPAEAESIQARRLRSVVVGAGDTVDGLAARMQVESHAAQWFRVLNGLQPGQGVDRGARVKLVV